MASYIDKKDTKLKWHRFTQIILMPLSLILTAYTFYEVTGIFFGFQDQAVTLLFTLAGLEVGNIYSILGPALLLLFALAGLFALNLFALIGSFRWHKYSLVCWLIHLLLVFLFSIAVFYALFNSIDIQTIVAFFASLGIHVNALFVRIVLMALLALTVVYFALSFIYYLKRRKLFRKKKDYPKQVIVRTVEKDPGVKQTPSANKDLSLKTEEPLENTTDMKQLSVETKDMEQPAARDINVADRQLPLTGTSDVREVTENTSSLEKLIDQENEDLKETENRPMGAKVLYCNKCGARILRDDAVFCSNCGAKLVR